METKSKPAPKPTLKAVPKKSTAKIAASDTEKMNKWNEKHPDAQFSWIVIDEKTPANQKACRMCKKEFREGRITRVDSKGAYCGPKCHRAAFVN